MQTGLDLHAHINTTDTIFLIPAWVQSILTNAIVELSYQILTVELGNFMHNKFYLSVPHDLVDSSR